MHHKIKIAIIAVVMMLCAGFYSAPYFTVLAMKSAADAKDAEKLSSYVNFPALKENLKGTFNAKVASEATKQENPFAALGAAMAAAFINPMVDAFVTPESLAMMMKGDKPQAGKSADASKSSDRDVDIHMAYESFDRFVVTVKKKDSNDAPVGLVFRREGLLSWKLAALRLPM